MKANILFFALLALGLVNPLVVVNSQDPMDVSSAVFFANARGEDLFFVSPGSDPLSTVRLVGRPGNIILVESPSRPVLAGLRSGFESNGNSVETVPYSGMELNFELARRSGTTKFVLTDPVYGYNAVSVAAYARSTGSYLLFANASTANEVGNFLRGRSPSAVLLYGVMDEEVHSSLAGFGINSEKIDNGDRYEDNIQLLDRYFAINPNKKDILLTDGSAWEASLTSASFPVLLVSDIIPENVYNYLLGEVTADQIRVGTLIGSDKLDPVYDMMKRVNNNFPEKRFSVFVKFGQAVSSGGEPAPLSMFPLPYPDARVSLVSATYNPSLGSFELTYSNTGNAQAYVKSSVVVLLDGQPVGAVGDDAPYLIRRGESKGMRYPFANPGEGQLAINDTTYYGISKFSFDKGFIKYMDVGRVSFVDNSQVSVSEASYSPLEDKLTLRVRNNGSEDAFYRLTVAYVNDEGLTVYEEESVRGIAAGRNDIVTLTGVVQLPQEKADSTQMNVTAAYGAREAFLEKEATALVKIESFPWWILLLLLLLLLIAYWYYRKRKGEKEAKAEKKK